MNWIKGDHNGHSVWQAARKNGKGFCLIKQFTNNNFEVQASGFSYGRSWTLEAAKDKARDAIQDEIQQLQEFLNE